MVSRFLEVTLVLCVFAQMNSAAPPVDANNLNVTSQRESRGIMSFFFGSRCPTPFPICPIDCSIDSAVVHGYCCGCGGFLEYKPIHCPDWLQCPIRGDQLCSDYRFVMDCCCGRPFF
ncbi:uncharacterized protein LOC132197772 [Neocloeon triangulifer]|uniref:uncharacterized protein LOC132197772 n=1 Tax=Neocloeon triangulifer TaxID=2078957 RepID=UPI00286F293A|nr:uncharacterized protein LOC132197772 [Neocloeon triangulifer]